MNQSRISLLSSLLLHLRNSNVRILNGPEQDFDPLVWQMLPRIRSCAHV